MADEAKLQELFSAFASFSVKADGLMDGARFCKFAKDAGLVDKKLTTTEVDLIFAKAKLKTERKISFPQFQDALQMMADKKFANSPSEERMPKLLDILNDVEGPVARGTAPKGGGIFDKLTDTSQYTGAHKERFDKDGKGRGLAGRDPISKGSGSANASIMRSDVKSGTTPTQRTPAAAAASPAKRAPAKKKDGASIFDKLTDPSQYTGAHKERFDRDGKGRGLAGRDKVRKGGAAGGDLSSLVSRK